MDETYDRFPRRRLTTITFNILTVLVLLATLGAAATMAALLINPYLSFNPYPPPTAAATLGPPTATSTPEITLPPAWTATVTVTPGPSLTPTITLTPTIEPSPTLDETQAAILTSPAFPFVVQQGNPVLIPNIANELECDWMGVGGQVFDADGSPIIGLSVHLEGVLEGQFLSVDTLTGSASSLGPSGYVFNLADAPSATEGDIWIQLGDTSGVPLSDQLFIDTSEACDENFILVNWRQIR